MDDIYIYMLLLNIHNIIYYSCCGLSLWLNYYNMLADLDMRAFVYLDAGVWSVVRFVYTALYIYSGS